MSSIQILVQGVAFVVRIPEVKANSFKDSLDEWRALALAENCASLVVIAVVDPLFPVSGNVKNYKIHDEPIRAEGEPPFKVTVMYTAELYSYTYESLNVDARGKLVKAAREKVTKLAKTPGRYQIILNGVILEAGRV